MLFDLLFAAAVLSSVTLFAFVAISALRGRGRRAAHLLLAWAASAALYFAVLSGVSWTSPQRVLNVGDARCFDDWCLTVEKVTGTPELGGGARRIRADGRFVVVTLRLSNRARGRTQRASSAAVRLLDARGARYEVSEAGQRTWEAEHGPAAPLTETISLGGSIETVRVFDVPTDALGLGLAVEHPVGFSPALFVIGDDASLFHKPTVVRLD
jgi:hypothetical protein